MRITLKIKKATGMFGMKDSELTVSEQEMTLSDTDGARSILLTEIEDISIARYKARAARFEISLKDETIRGVFAKKEDADMFMCVIKDTMEPILHINFQK